MIYADQPNFLIAGRAAVEAAAAQAGPAAEQAAALVPSVWDECSLPLPGEGVSSNTPSSNVKLGDGEAARVLASGDDSLYLSLDVEWEPLSLVMLMEWKEQAKLNEADTAVLFKVSNSDGCAFGLKAFGIQNYAYVLKGKEYDLSIGNWALPKKTIPSVLVQIHAETLWRLGEQAAVERLIALIVEAGGNVQAVRVSRADVCVDLLLPASTWVPAIQDEAVTRAATWGSYRWRRAFTGVTYGKGEVVGRIYDKMAEIKTKSGKWWLLDVWKINGVDESCRVVRVEFQLRRAALKEMGVDTWEDWKAKRAGVWKYCCSSWLRMVDDPKKHHTMQTVQPWWVIAQTGYDGADKACEAVRVKACRVDRKQLVQQIVGLVSAVAAVDLQDEVVTVTGLKWWLRAVNGYACDYGIGDISGKIEGKRERYMRAAGAALLPVWETAQPGEGLEGVAYV